MTWLLWRQHRMQGAVAVGLLAVFGALLAISGVAMANAYKASIACHESGGVCGVSAIDSYGPVVALVNLTVAVPLLIGVFWGVTSVGREYDTGINVLAWTQSVTRRRWLRSKVATLLVSSAVAGAALSGMVTWWSRTPNSYHGDRFDPLQFDLQGVVPVAYTVFAAALGLFAGVVWRRVLPAIATTVAGYVAVRLVIEQWVRPNYQTPVTASTGGGPGAWSRGSELMHNGTVIAGPVRVPDDCVAIRSRAPFDACMARHGYHASSTYQPAGRYWTFQWIEAGIFVGISALLVTAAVVLVLRRDA